MPSTVTRSTRTRSTVLVVGDVLTDTVVRLHSPLAIGTDAPASITDTPGGQGANVARWLVAAGASQVRLLATVSHADPVDHAAQLTACGVMAALTRVDEPVARIVVVVDEHGRDRSFLTQRGAAAALSEIEAEAVELTDVGWCHVSGYVLESATGRACFARLASRCRSMGITVSVDPASVSLITTIGVATFRELVSGIDVLFPNDVESAVLSSITEPKTAARELTALAPCVVVTCGEAGAVASSHETGPLHIRPVATPVIDPTGAGDAFAAGFIAARLNGADVADALGRAAAMGAAAVATLGAAPPKS